MVEINDLFFEIHVSSKYEYCKCPKIPYTKVSDKMCRVTQFHQVLCCLLIHSVVSSGSISRQHISWSDCTDSILHG